jgi:anti-sigma B factor antagonist
MQRRGDAVILWLRGELDLATSALLELELDGAQVGVKRLIVDLTGLELIDSVGLATLVQARQRACDNGQELSFTRGLNLVDRAVALSGDLGLRSRSVPHPEAATNENYYFALAMACVDVDHQCPPGDRPRGTTDRFPD